MARYNGLIIPRSYNDYFSRSDPQAIRDIVALAADGELNAASKNPLQNQAIAKIVPNTASETNKLADKNFVNSTVGTNTANYIYKTESGGEKVPFSSVAELEAYAGTVTNNDYAFVTGIDENGNTYYDRYKADVNDGVVTWAKEYRLNNSSFTAEQWAAIQSGITAEKVAQFEGAVSPVDVVQSGNMSAVTSNAVNAALTDAATIQQALQLPGVLSEAVAAGDNKAVKSSAVNTALVNNYINIINHTVNYQDKTIHYDCNDYLNKNIEIFANIEQFDNLPAYANEALAAWFVSRGENLTHNDAAKDYRNIQEVRIIKFVTGEGWQTKCFRRFAIDTTIFSWVEI